MANRNFGVKKSKSGVDYGPGMAKSHCGPVAEWLKGECKHFSPPHSCHKVAGYIEARGWCKLWEKK